MKHRSLGGSSESGWTLHVVRGSYFWQSLNVLWAGCMHLQNRNRSSDKALESGPSLCYREVITGLLFNGHISPTNCTEVIEPLKAVLQYAAQLNSLARLWHIGRPCLGSQTPALIPNSLHWCYIQYHSGQIQYWGTGISHKKEPNSIKPKLFFLQTSIL